MIVIWEDSRRVSAGSGSNGGPVFHSEPQWEDGFDWLVSGQLSELGVWLKQFSYRFTCQHLLNSAVSLLHLPFLPHPSVSSHSLSIPHHFATHLPFCLLLPVRSRSSSPCCSIIVSSPPPLTVICISLPTSFHSLSPLAFFSFQSS